VLSEFRSDISALFDEQVIDDAVDHARPLELPPRDGRRYYAFVDPSGGRHDAFTLAIGHTEGRKDAWVCDVVRGRQPPFQPGSVAQEYAALARQYGCTRITGDNFSAEWVAQAFRDAGMFYETSSLNKSQLYLEALGFFNAGRVRLPAHEKLLRELRMLERRVHRSGKDSVDHPRASSDDFANALAGAMYLAMQKSRRGFLRVGFGAGILPKIQWQDQQPRHTAFDFITVHADGSETKQTRLLQRTYPTKFMRRA
jgi:hypothetical protein